MTKLRGYFIFVITLIVSISLSGCVAPPAEQAIIPVDNYDSNQLPSVETTATGNSAYVTEVTPFVFVTPVDTKITHNTPSPTPETPKDIRCRIYTQSQIYAYNGSAFTFNLKNPPMLINYTVIPTNITEKRLVSSKTGTKAESVISIDTYSPYSWLEITIRNATTGEIYQQDGFQKGHSTYLTNTLKVNKQDNLLIEIQGNLITASINFWVKPEINFDNTQIMDSMVCTEIEQTRSTLAYVTATPTTTWNG